MLARLLILAAGGTFRMLLARVVLIDDISGRGGQGDGVAISSMRKELMNAWDSAKKGDTKRTQAGNLPPKESNPAKSSRPLVESSSGPKAGEKEPGPRFAPEGSEEDPSSEELGLEEKIDLLQKYFDKVDEERPYVRPTHEGEEQTPSDDIDALKRREGEMLMGAKGTRKDILNRKIMEIVKKIEKREKVLKKLAATRAHFQTELRNIEKEGELLETSLLGHKSTRDALVAGKEEVASERNRASVVFRETRMEIERLQKELEVLKNRLAGMREGITVLDRRETIMDKKMHTTGLEVKKSEIEVEERKRERTLVKERIAEANREYAAEMEELDRANVEKTELEQERKQFDDLEYLEDIYDKK